MRWNRFPLPDLRHGLELYLEERVVPGDFLLAVLQNNLREAVAYADAMSRARLCDLVSWLWNNVPARCWGSEDTVLAWLQGGDDDEAAEVGARV